jgi:VWFA-related protein
MQTSRSAALAAALCATSFVLAQAPTPPSPSAPPVPVLAPVETEVVYVDVAVTGKDGRPARGLSAADFEVREDGQRVEILNFSTGDDPAAVDPAAPTVSVPDAPPVTVGREPASAEQQVRLVVFVDNASLHPANRARVFAQLRLFLTNRPTHEQVMVVSAERGWRTRQAFTDDMAAVRDVLKSIEKEHGAGARLELDRRLVLRQLETASNDTPGESDRLLDQVRNYAVREHDRVVASLATLGNFVDLMGGLPGRKAVVYVSDGLPTRPGADMFLAWRNAYGDRNNSAGVDTSIFSEMQNYRPVGAFEDVARRANANRVTFYAVDAASASPNFDVSADEAGAGALGDRRVSSADVNAEFALDRSSSLGLLADATGGLRLAANSKLAQRLGELASDLGASYSLAYAPPRVGEGRFHKIEVKLKTPGLKVRHREGYFDKTAEQRAEDQAFAALLSAVDNPLGIALELGATKPGDKGGFVVPVLVKVALDKLVLARQDGADVGRLTCFIVVQDLKGGLSAVQKRALPVRFAAGQIKAGAKQVAGFPLPLAFKAGEYSVGIAVKDELGARRGAASIRVKL